MFTWSEKLSYFKWKMEENVTQQNWIIYFYFAVSIITVPTLTNIPHLVL